MLVSDKGWRVRGFAVVVAALLSATPAIAADRSDLGPFGPEGPRMREQFWVLPSGDPDSVLRATVFRPDDAADAAETPQRPLVVINHGTSSATRLSVAMPVYYWLSRWFVDRGYVVVLPQRRGHGATGGPLAEAIGNCSDPDHARSGEIAADDIEAVVDFMASQPFVRPQSTVVVGISTGGWASLALAARKPSNVAAVINIAGGRGGYAGGKPNNVCAERRLIDAVSAYGRTARVPTLWLYSENDSYFGPKLAKAMADAWRSAGAEAELHILPAYGTEGHDIANDRAGWDVWGEVADRFLGTHGTPPVASGMSELATAEGSSAP